MIHSPTNNIETIQLFIEHVKLINVELDNYPVQTGILHYLNNVAEHAKQAEAALRELNESINTR